MPFETDAGARRPRLRDIAERCGVSVSTVSRALAGRKGVRPDLVRRVVEEAQLIRYPFANSLAGHRVLVAASEAAMIDYGRNQFTWLVLEGLRAGARAKEAELVPLALPDRGGGALIEEAMDDPDMAALILLTIDDVGLFDLAWERKWNTVLVNSEDPWMRLSSICPCNRSAARFATDYLLDRGHTEIAFVVRHGRHTIHRRQEGWRDALAARGIAPDEVDIITVGDFVPELAEAAVRERLDRSDFPYTAVLCAADSLAVGTLRALTAHGVSVPGDISVVGMDDLPVGDFLKPRLTTIHIPSHDLGLLAFDVLHEQTGDPGRLPRVIELACRMTERESVATHIRAAAE